jgi:hypothetical protein
MALFTFHRYINAMRLRLSPSIRHAFAAATLALVSGTGSACLPSLPGDVPPTEQEKVADVGRHATDIVYGIVTRGSDSGKSIRFRIIHVYRGAHRAGEIVDVRPGWGLDGPPCILTPPPVIKGAYGVIFFYGDPPELHFLSDRQVQMMFEGGWIRSARLP